MNYNFLTEGGTYLSSHQLLPEQLYECSYCNNSFTEQQWQEEVKLAFPTDNTSFNIALSKRWDFRCPECKSITTIHKK